MKLFPSILVLVTAVFAADEQELVCPEGWEQEGDINADIIGCGLETCDDRASVDIEGCALHCEQEERCNSFTYAPVGGDQYYMDRTVCTIYEASMPTHTSEGPNQIFCRSAYTQGPTVIGEPHFQTWSGEKYDFHGVCDLVFLENKNFKDGIDMDIHVRTKGFEKKFSYVSNAVLRIGDDSLEVSAGNDGSKGVYWINGVSGKEINENSDFILSETIYGYPITYRRPNGKQAEFEVDLGNDDNIIIRTWGEFVRVGMNGNPSNFKNSRGLTGRIDGAKVARDNITVIDDANEFGQEWQVLSYEPMLFHNREGPQHPEKCIIPSAVDMKRRLRESSISQEEAELACSRVTETERDMCVFDVMATSSLDTAGAY